MRDSEIRQQLLRTGNLRSYQVTPNKTALKKLRKQQDKRADTGKKDKVA